MAKTKLKSIELTYFRGATIPVTIDFDPGKKVTMIYGENGSGKSSVVDAFDFLCERDYGSLNDRKGADRDLLTAITGTIAQLGVKLTTDKGEWEAKFKPNTKTIVVSPNNGCPDARILRRANILRLIDEIPSQRFQALKEYIDVSGIEKCEKSLGDAIRSKESEQARHVQAYAQAENSLTQMWVAENSPGKTAEKWAEQEAAKDAATLRATDDEVGKLLGAISELERLQDDRGNANKVLSDSVTALDKATEEQKAEEAKVIGENPGVLAVLRSARDYIVGHATEGICPVCQKPADASHLAEELSTRISGMSALTTATSKTVGAKKATDNAQARLTSIDAQLVKCVRDAIGKLTASQLPPVTALALPAVEVAVITGDSVELATRVSAVETIIDLMGGLKVPLDTYRKGGLKTLAQRAAIGTQLTQIRQSRSAQEATEAVLKQLKATLTIVGAARKAFVKEVLESVSNEIECLYLKLHPNESIGHIKLSLDPDNFGSLYLQGDFHSKKDVPPQSVYSESHLDTLGFCVFLALAKLYKTDDTIIILDDVLTSVDAQHLDRFVSLIHDEQQHFSHIVVTTHYRPWCEQYRHHRAPGNKVHFVEFRGWALESGIRVQQMRLCMDEIRQALAAKTFDRQLVASKSGIFLESMLEFLAMKYECRLPFKARSGYTLGELTNCFSSKKLLPALMVERATKQKDAAGKDQEVWVKIPLAPLIAQIKQWAEVRNSVGCHFNAIGALCTDNDVEELAKATLALGDALVCPIGGDFPSRSDSGSYHETRSRQIRLHPFAEPN